jgi:hypothetical protein
MLATEKDTVETLIAASDAARAEKLSNAEETSWKEEEKLLLQAIDLLTEIKIQFARKAKVEQSEGRFSSEARNQLKRLNRMIRIQTAECYRKLDVLAAARKFNAEAFHKLGSPVV